MEPSGREGRSAWVGVEPSFFACDVTLKIIIILITYDMMLIGPIFTDIEKSHHASHYKSRQRRKVGMRHL